MVNRTSKMIDGLARRIATKMVKKKPGEHKTAPSLVELRERINNSSGVPHGNLGRGPRLNHGQAGPG